MTFRQSVSVPQHAVLTWAGTYKIIRSEDLRPKSGSAGVYPPGRVSQTAPGCIEVKDIQYKWNGRRRQTGCIDCTGYRTDGDADSEDRLSACSVSKETLIYTVLPVSCL